MTANWLAGLDGVLPPTSKGGRPRTKGLREPGWMLARMLILVSAYNDARRKESTYRKSVASAVEIARAAGFLVSESTARNVIRNAYRQLVDLTVAAHRPDQDFEGLAGTGTDPALLAEESRYARTIICDALDAGHERRGRRRVTLRRALEEFGIDLEALPQNIGRPKILIFPFEVAEVIRERRSGRQFR